MSCGYSGCSGVLIQRGIAQKLGLTWTPCRTICDYGWMWLYEGTKHQ